MSFKDWYVKNRERLNKKRRKRYKTDAVYRRKQLKNTSHWRKKRAVEKSKEPVRPKTLFTIGEVAREIDCEDKTIRNLEKAGLIPVSSDGVHHRRFNKRQITLIQRIVDFRKSVHYKHPKYEPRLNVLKERAHARWS